MEQSVPNAAHQAINVAEAPNEKANVKDGCYTIAATVFGVLQIICGVITIIFESDYMNIISSNISYESYSMPSSLGTGIWTSVLFFISGGLAIGGAHTGNKCLVVATMVMSIISAVAAMFLIILSFFLFLESIDNVSHAIAYAAEAGAHGYYNNNDSINYNNSDCIDIIPDNIPWPYCINLKALIAQQEKAEPTLGLLMLMGVIMSLIAIISASLTGKPLCCLPTNQNQNQFHQPTCCWRNC